MDMGKIQCNKCGSDNLSTSKYCCNCGCELPKTLAEITAPAPPVKSRRKLTMTQITGIVVGIVLAASVSILAQKDFLKEPLVDKVLMEMASEINKSLPVMIDSITRCDNLLALPDKTISYNCTILTDFETVMLDTLVAKQVLEPRILNTIKTYPDTKYFRDNDVTMKYCYKDESGNYLFSIVITPTQYK